MLGRNRGEREGLIRIILCFHFLGHKSGFKFFSACSFDEARPCLSTFNVRIFIYRIWN